MCIDHILEVYKVGTRNSTKFSCVKQYKFS